jgi:hypothetical protein
MINFRIALACLASLTLIACGGGGSGGGSTSMDSPEPLPTTGTVGLFLTDKPSEEFSEINIWVSEAVLIGGAGQQTLFQGSREINLLDLTNYNEPIIFGEVLAGNYTKLRLNIARLELVPLDGSDPIEPKLPANGKIDLLDQDGFDILPGRTVVIEIDIDANKSIKVTKAGNKNKYNFRPVVKVDIMDGGLPHKLARVEGIVKEVPADPAGSFVLCAVDMPDNCISVHSDAGTGIFDDQGLDTAFSTLMVNDSVVVIGRYEIDPDILLNALVLEIGGNAEQVSGSVVSDPVGGQFLLLMVDGSEVVVELQVGSKFFDADGEVSPDSVAIGAKLEVEGVMPEKADTADPDLIRAALVFVEAADGDQLSGTIILPVDAVGNMFGLIPADGSGDTCFSVIDGAQILLVDVAASEVMAGTIEDLAVDQLVDLFGEFATDSCFMADEIIVEVVTATP